MSVPSWRRTIAKSEYIHRAYTLAQYIGLVVANKPKKYKPTYGDRLINASLDLLSHCQIANSIYVYYGMLNGDFETRRQHLLEARGLTDYIGTTSFIFLELCRGCDGVSFDKISHQEEHIGIECSNLRNFITSVLKSDVKRIG